VKYPEELKQKVVSRMMAPRNEAVSVLAREFNVTKATLYAWRRIALEAGIAAPGDGRNAENWRGSAKFAVVLETAALAEAELGDYCRARGLFPEQVRSWRAVCELAFDPAEAGSKANSAKADRQRIRELEKDLGRKDRALAETAALLILRKKAAAIWGEEKDE
jgi:transposase-like protein